MSSLYALTFQFALQANQEAGLLNPIQKNEQVNYWPSSVEHRDEVESKKGMFPKANGPTGDREKSDYGNGKSIIGDDYKQARDRIHSFDSERCALQMFLMPPSI